MTEIILYGDFRALNDRELAAAIAWLREKNKLGVVSRMNFEDIICTMQALTAERDALRNDNAILAGELDIERQRVDRLEKERASLLAVLEAAESVSSNATMERILYGPDVYAVDEKPMKVLRQAIKRARSQVGSEGSRGGEDGNG